MFMLKKGGNSITILHTNPLKIHFWGQFGGILDFGTCPKTLQIRVITSAKS